MTRDELIAKLRELGASDGHEPTEKDPEDDHMKADGALLEFIDDAQVTEAFNAIEKWYA